MQKKLITILALALIVIGAYAIVNKQSIKQTPKLNIGIDVGEMAPDFSLTTIDGEKITKASLRGNIVVITSSAAWCPTCVMEARQFSPVYYKYQEEGVVFITVDIDPRDSKSFIQQFKTGNNTPWYYADAEGGAEIIQKYSLNRFEITYILDKQGIIRFKDKVITSSDKLDMEIQKLL